MNLDLQPAIQYELGNQSDFLKSSKNLMDISYTTKRWSYLLCFPNVDGDRFRCCSLNAFYYTFLYLSK